MKRFMRSVAPLALLLSVSACSLSSIVGGGGKVPPTLLTLTAEAPSPGEFARSAAAGEAITIAVPVVPKELRTVRIAAQASPTDVAYLTDVQLVDTPDRLFQDLLAETVRRTTNRVVLAPQQSNLDPGLVVSGHLSRFGYDEATQSAVVRYDGALSTTGGTRVETRRFEASVPAPADQNIGPFLNRAANEVAREAARWIAAG